MSKTYHVTADVVVASDLSIKEADIRKRLSERPGYDPNAPITDGDLIVYLKRAKEEVWDLRTDYGLVGTLLSWNYYETSDDE